MYTYFLKWRPSGAVPKIDHPTHQKINLSQLQNEKLIKDFNRLLLHFKLLALTIFIKFSSIFVQIHKQVTFLYFFKSTYLMKYKFDLINIGTPLFLYLKLKHNTPVIRRNGVFLYNRIFCRTRRNIFFVGLLFLFCYFYTLFIW